MAYTNEPLPGDLIPGAVGLSLYTWLFMASAYLFGRLLWQQRKTLWEFTVPKFFHVTLLLFIILRFWWIIIRMATGSGNQEYITNRLALLLFFTAFALVVFHWADQFRQTLHDAHKLSPMTRVTYGFLVGLVWIAQFIIGGLYLSEESYNTTETNLLYNLNTVGVAILNLILSVAFLIYGLRWYMLTKDSPDDYAEKRTELGKIIVLTLVFVVCFFVRVFTWSYRLGSGGELMPEGAWLPVSYYVPELIPCALQLYIIEETNFKQEESHYIASLYNPSDTDDDYEGKRRHSGYWDANVFSQLLRGGSRGSRPSSAPGSRHGSFHRGGSIQGL